MYDYHTHSDFSGDCNTPMREMIDAAIKTGIKEIAVTDHYDPDYPDNDYPFTIDFPEYHKLLPIIEHEYGDRIKVVKGIEIGIQPAETLIKCEAALNAFPYDFVLGAFHATDKIDLFTDFFKYKSVENGFYDYYVNMAECLRDYANYDVLAHINIIDRYSPYVPDYAPYMDIIENILASLIGNGKGLEINTSSYRYGMNDRTIPPEDILKLYKSLGGEIITVGSDAHKPRDVGYKYDIAVEILKNCGFKYISTFKNRKVDFVKI